MIRENKIFLGMADGERVEFDLKMTNRHGLIAGATGTGKTVSLKVLAESFSDAGVPVFMADVKGDLAGMYAPGSDEKESVRSKVEAFKLNEDGFAYRSYPVNFWDVYAQGGMPLRTTVSEMGPLLMARILGLSDTQTSVLTVVYKIADDNDLLLIDTKDLKAMLAYVEENSDQFAMDYGNMSKQSLAVIVRAVVALESQGGEQFFGEPALDISDWLTTNYDRKGMIQILDARQLVNSPSMYSTFLLWMISELYETLPEVGDLEKPRMVFFFDEAHLLFNDAPKVLTEKVEQVVKLIRSKGVGIYFCTQNPKDIPDSVLSQLSNKVQHGLRAYTPADQKAVKAAAESYRVNPDFDTFDTILNLGIGEAVVSFLGEDGVPGMAEKVSILPPASSFSALDEGRKGDIVRGSALYKKYVDPVDRDSAYEFFLRRGEEEAKAREDAAIAKEEEKAAAKAEKEAARAAEKERNAKKRAVKSVGNSVAGTVGREMGKAAGSSFGKFGKTLGGNVGAALGRGILSTLLKM